MMLLLRINNHSELYTTLLSNLNIILNFSQDQMFNLVSDVKNYEAFLPFCTKSTVLETNSDGNENEGPKELIANLEIGFPPIIENYTSTIVMNKPRSVQACCKEGKLFTFLETTWVFTSIPQGDPNTCIVDFSIRFQFRSMLYSHLASIFFNKLVKNMEQAFIEEARRRYGKVSAPVFEIDEHEDNDDDGQYL